MKTVIKFFLFISLLISSFSVFAQDIIVLKSGDVINANVQEVEVETVKYKKHGTTGPTYTILKSDILMIEYQNGEKDVFSTTIEKVQKEENIQSQQKNVQEPMILTYKSGDIYCGSTKLSSKDVRNILSINSKALKKYNGSRTLNTFNWIFSLTSSLFFASCLSDVISGNDVSPESLAAGIVCFATGLSFDLIGRNQRKSAITLYNSSVSNKHTSTSVLKFGITNSGVGLTLNF